MKSNGFHDALSGNKLALPLRSLAAVVALLIGVISTLRAADLAVPKPKPPVVFTVMAWDVLAGDADLILNYTPKGEEPRPVTITWRNLSPAYVCDGPGPLVFSRTIEREGKRIEMPVATADIPEGMSRVLLVFGRNPSREPGAPAIRIKTFNDGYDVFPGQSVRFLNYASAELGGSVGEQSFSVASGGDQVVPAALPAANRLLPFRLARRDADGWKKLRSTGLPMSPGLRVLIFLVDDPRSPGSPEMVMLNDQVELPAPAPSLGSKR